MATDEADKTREEAAADFRYDTGNAAVPWAAVGEHLNTTDLMKLVTLLVRPKAGCTSQYKAGLGRVEAALEELWLHAQPATKLSLGDKVKELESRCARFLNVRHACFLTNATAGFEIGLKFAGLAPGDEVIAPPLTFIATILYPLEIGAKVVFADVDPRTLNLDPEDVARKITARTRAILPVHLGGYPVDMDPLMELAGAHDLIVVEDAAHAFGGVYRGRMTGTIGHFGAYSFHEVKNINALGEGGLLVTDTAFGEQFAKARFVGLDSSRQLPNWLYDVVALEGRKGPVAAGNHSTTEIQAACLLTQMARLKQVIQTRRRRAEYLSEQFESVAGLLTPPLDDDHVKSTHHLYLLQLDPDKAGGDIQELKARLNEKGVVNIPHFAPLYKFALLRSLNYEGDALAKGCPVAEEAFNRRFTHLPLYPLEDSQVELMARLVREAMDEMRRG
jgi:dTDP-4-amino-4,6-dideoxygalactose transaminase